MKTYLIVQVRNESIISRCCSFWWFINIFKKMPVNMFLDGHEPRELKAAKKPYRFAVDPGEHQVIFTDPRAENKKRYDAALGAMFGGIFGLATGGSVLGHALAGANDVRNVQLDEAHGALTADLQEGDKLTISVKPTRKGSVKIKVLK